VLTGGFGQEGGCVVRVYRGEREEHEDGEKAENPTGKTTLSGVDADLALQADSISKQCRGFVEYLNEIAAGLALNEHRGNKESYVSDRDAFSEVQQSVSQGQAEVLLFGDTAELLANGVGDLLTDEIECGSKGMPGAESTRVRENTREPLELALSLRVDERIGCKESGDRNERRDYSIEAEELADPIGSDGGNERTE
jgi:hypothetical protein